MRHSLVLSLIRANVIIIPSFSMIARRRQIWYNAEAFCEDGSKIHLSQFHAFVECDISRRVCSLFCLSTIVWSTTRAAQSPIDDPV